MSAFESIAAEKIGEEYEVLFDWTPEVFHYYCYHCYRVALLLLL